jgi:hypothetical protein
MTHGSAGRIRLGQDVLDLRGFSRASRKDEISDLEF